MVTRRFALTGLAAACLPPVAFAHETAPLPGPDGWPIASPYDAGFDPDGLHTLAQVIESGVNMPNVHALLIEHAGHLVFERYWPGDDYSFATPLGRVDHGTTTLHDIRSISKNVTSLLMGIALGEGAQATLARPIADFFPNRSGVSDAITLGHALTMTAGLDWNTALVPYDNPRNDFRRMIATDDPIGFVLAKDQRDPPGTRWIYNGGLTNVTAAILEGLTGQPFVDFAQQALFGPLGITDFDWFRPPHWPSGGIPGASFGLRLRARDLAKIGSVVLHGGQWQGRQIVPRDWVTASTARQFEGPGGRYGYGYFWFRGNLISGQDVILASGYGDQWVFVLPAQKLAITILAGNYDTGGGDIGERIVGRILRARQT